MFKWMMLVPLALALASCGAVVSPVEAPSPAVQAQGFPGLPDPSCITANGAAFTPQTIGVSRSPAPTAPNTNVAVTFGSTTPATLSLSITAPVGFSLSWSSRTVTGASTTQSYPLLVRAGPGVPNGQYQIAMAYSPNSWCPKAILTVNVN